jgi:hypothetical protein
MQCTKRWGIAILSVAVILAVGYAAAYWYGNRPGSAVVVVMSPELKDGFLVISVVATNTGRVPLVYHGWPTFADLQVKTDREWSNVPQQYVSMRSTFDVLLPGGSLRYGFKVPQHVTHVRVGCPFETAGIRTWIFAQLRKAGWKRCYQLWMPMSGVFPDGTGEDVEFWSPETKVN